MQSQTFELVNPVLVVEGILLLCSGYMREIEILWKEDNNAYYTIPPSIQHICLTYYHILYNATKYNRLINDWYIGDTIARGDTSKVKIGINRKTAQKAALKIIFQNLKNDFAYNKDKIFEQIDIIKKIKHENVIQLIECHENTQYTEKNDTKTKCVLIVLELAALGELYDFICFAGYFDETATRTYFHQMISGLEAIHKLGIVHRDLKPESLFINENYVLKIGGFRCAKEVLYETDEYGNDKPWPMTTIVGTKGYLAPEMLKGKQYTHKIDIFALGVILFITYSGFPPFQNAIDTDWWWDKLKKGWKYMVKMKNNHDDQKYKDAAMIKFGLFWKAHERTRKFEKVTLKNLIQAMLHPYHQYRLNIDQIKQHEWYIANDIDNKIYDSQEMKIYLQAHIQTVTQKRNMNMKKV